MANTHGHRVFHGQILFEEDKLGVAEEILQGAGGKKAKILLPVDVVITEELLSGATFRVAGTDEIPEGWSAVDLGPQTVQLFKDTIVGSKTVIWNGPLGAYEFPPFNKGTEEVITLQKLNLSLAEGYCGCFTGSGYCRSLHLSTGSGAVLKFWGGTFPLEAQGKMRQYNITNTGGVFRGHEGPMVVANWKMYKTLSQACNSSAIFPKKSTMSAM